MSSAVKFVGRTNNFSGKTLWEIVGSLKNFGVGRVVIRNTFQRYPEPTYMRILKVEADPETTTLGEYRKVRVTVEKTFRGRVYPKPIEIFSTSYKADYRLVPKHEEANICRSVPAPAEKLLAPDMEMPPLLREFVKLETGESNPRVPIKLKPTREKHYRIAQEGETPTVQVSVGFGQSASPALFEDVLR